MQLVNIRKSVRFAVFGDSSNTAYADADIDRNVNLAYRKWLTIALLASGRWQVRGTYAYLDLKANVYKYAIDAEILKFNRVEAKLTTNGKWQLITPIDISEINEPLETYQPISPEYDLRGDYLTIYTDEEIEDVDAGLKFYVNRDLTELVNTTDEPDLSEAFIELIILDAAIKYCTGNELAEKKRELKNDIAELRPDFEEFYATRSPEAIVMRPKKKNLY